jgi:hypothetical protein
MTRSNAKRLEATVSRCRAEGGSDLSGPFADQCDSLLKVFAKVWFAHDLDALSQVETPDFVWSLPIDPAARFTRRVGNRNDEYVIRSAGKRAVLVREEDWSEGRIVKRVPEQILAAPASRMRGRKGLSSWSDSTFAFPCGRRLCECQIHSTSGGTSSGLLLPAASVRREGAETAPRGLH